MNLAISFPELMGSFPELTGSFPELTGSFPELARVIPVYDLVNSLRANHSQATLVKSE